MNKLSLYICLLCCLFFLVHPPEAPCQARERVAVLSFLTMGGSEGYTRIVRDSLEMALFMKNTFTLLERNQIRRAFADSNLEPHNCRSSQCIKSIATMLSARFIITGTLEKNEGYTIYARVHFMPESRIISIYQQEFKNEEDRRTAVKALAEKITRGILNYGREKQVPKKKKAETPPPEKTKKPENKKETSFFLPMNLLIDWVMVLPAGKFNDLVSVGYGFHCSIEAFPFAFIRKGFPEYIFLGIKSGYQSFTGDINENDRATLVPMIITAGLQYPLTRLIHLRCSIGGGATRVTLSHATGDGFDMTDNSSASSVEGTLSFSAGGGFSVNERLCLFSEWFYTMRFEQSGPVHSTGLSIMAALKFTL